MADDSPATPATDAASDFQRCAEMPQIGLVAEFLLFLRHNKKWWLVPILLMLALLSGLVFLSSTASVPWIYAIF